MKYKLGTQELEMDGKYLTRLRDSNDIIDDVEALRQRMREDGYLLIREFHDSQQVLKARSAILKRLHALGRLAPGTDVEEGIIHKDNIAKSAGKDRDMTEIPEYRELVDNERPKQFFDRFLGGESMCYDYKWLRATGNGQSSTFHYDVVYMGRGTKNLYTLWTPLGNVSLDMGPLAICLGSQHFDKLINTYGQMDVDKDRIEGGFSRDPIEIVDKFGGKWASADFAAGDAILFGMYMLHGSLVNASNRYRISTDMRFQLKAEPADERWVGKIPKGHDARGKEAAMSITEARAKWGV